MWEIAGTTSAWYLLNTAAENAKAVLWLVAFVGCVTWQSHLYGNKCRDSSLVERCAGSHHGWAASSFGAQCECAVACWAGPCWPHCSRKCKYVKIPGKGIRGPGDRSALLLRQREAVLVLRTRQKVSAAAGLVSSGYFLASKPQLAG